eukprot:TRINITY_DN1537_c0_g1_i8.p1 TRINITY_DN1537_c0_g1~~TRINITY_DN1537_c0_g1_i8.p1  ORF type:complete len:155 (-),score=21.44 TRINITY_DN1537_c0_g1_i8:102-566(-)
MFKSTLFVILACMLSQIVYSATTNNKILIISIYNENSEYGMRQIGGIEKGLTLGGVPLSSVVYKSFFMDTVGTYTTNPSVNWVSNFITDLIKTWNPAVVVFAGDRAFQRVALPYQQMRLKDPNTLPEIPFVFCGVNEDMTHTSNNANYTGIISI